MCMNHVGGFNCTCKPGFEPRTDEPSKCQRESSLTSSSLFLRKAEQVSRLDSLCCLLLAVCEPSCQNYGVCVAPNTCDCPAGYPGPGCSGIVNCVLCKMIPIFVFLIS